MTKPTKWHVRPAKTQISLSFPQADREELQSDWADAQADLSFRWAHMPFCWLCHEAAQMANSADPDQTAPSETADLVLHFLPRPFFPNI